MAPSSKLIDVLEDKDELQNVPLLSRVENSRVWRQQVMVDYDSMSGVKEMLSFGRLFVRGNYDFKLVLL